jgi:UDP-N-acetyl-D-galactosamine dehydrogenase
MVNRLRWLGHRITIHDPMADAEEVQREFGLPLDPDALSRRYDVVLAAVPHRSYRDFGAEEIAALAAPDALIADVHNIWRDRELNGHARWTL